MWSYKRGHWREILPLILLSAMTVMVYRHKVLNLQQLLLLVFSVHIATSGVDFRITESALIFTSGQYGLDGILKCSDIIILNDQVYYYCCY